MADARPLRLFVALDLPDEVRGALGDWAARVAPQGVRRVPDENLHVTLAFLGSRPRAQAAAVAAVLAAVAAPVGELRTGRALWLPLRRPGVLTVALQRSEALAGLQRSLAVALAGAIGYEPERRRFRAHVTVGRVGRGTRVRGEEPREQPSALAFVPDGLTLYRSYSGPGGSRYEPLARVQL